MTKSVKIGERIGTGPQYEGPIEYESEVLRSLGLSTGAACDHCPNAGWHVTGDSSLRLFCKSMSVLIDSKIVACELLMQTLKELRENSSDMAD